MTFCILGGKESKSVKNNGMFEVLMRRMEQVCACLGFLFLGAD